MIPHDLLLLSVLKTDELLNIFVETFLFIFKWKKNSIYFKQKSLVILLVFLLSLLGQFNGSLLNKI